MSDMSQSALVTGGTGGLGTAVTRAFLDSGWRVVVPSSRAGEGLLEPHERLEVLRADLTTPDGAARAVAAAGDGLGAVVNLVGGYAAGGRVHETPVEDFEAMLRVNLRPAYLACAAALPRLLAAGGGAIVCVSARSALRPASGMAGYVTAKRGVLALVDALHVEYAREGVRANAVVPSLIDTPANRAAMPDADHASWPKPEAIARVIVFLCSDDAAATSGAHVPV